MGKNTTNYLLLLVLVLIVAFGTGMVSYSATGVHAGGTPTQVSHTGQCPSSGQTKLLFAAYNDLTPSKDQVATNVSVFLKGIPHPFETIRTSTDGFVTAPEALDCGTTFTAIYGYGDESNYYENWVEGLKAGDAASVNVNEPVQKVGSLEVSGRNATDQGVASGLTLNLATGEGSSDVVLTMKENTPKAYYGQGKVLVCTQYNTSDFDTVEVVGGTPTTVPTIATGYQKCYDVDANLVDFSSKDVRLNIQTKSDVDPSNTTIGVKIFDYQNFEYQGKKYFTVANPADDSAIGAPDVTYTINVN